MSRKNPRLVKVKTIFDSADAKLLGLYQKSLDAANVRKVVIDSSVDIRKNDDDNTALIQKDILSSTSRLVNIIEKVLYLSCISILLNVIILCIC